MPEEAKKPRPNVRQRWVARRITRWRELHTPYLSQAATAALLDWHKSKLSRFESCAAIIRPSDIAALAAYLRISDDERDRVVALAAAGLRSGDDVGWAQTFGDEVVPDFAADYLECEAFAAGVKTMQQVVPGLLQSPRYTDALVRQSVAGATESVMEMRRQLRRQRQARLDDTDRPLSLDAVIPEHAVLRQPGADPATMVEQLDLLVDRAGQSNVTIQVLPAEVWPHPAIGESFSILEFRDGDTEAAEAVYLENLAAGTFAEEPRTVKFYLALYGKLAMDDPTTRGWALNPDASIQRLKANRMDWASRV